MVTEYPQDRFRGARDCGGIAERQGCRQQARYFDISRVVISPDYGQGVGPEPAWIIVLVIELVKLRPQRIQTMARIG